MKAIVLERGQRTDDKWWLRLSLAEPSLKTEFAGLCQDIIVFTSEGVSADSAAVAVLARVERWRALLESDRGGLSANRLKGLIGELAVLMELLDHLAIPEAVSSWNGPLGSPQDFMLPDGQRIEVKAIRTDADAVRINGIDQLDAGTDPVELRVARVADARPDTEGAVTVPHLINELSARMAPEPLALNEFLSRLAAGGWYEHPRHDEFAVRIVSIHRYQVEGEFPRIAGNDVPEGVDDVNYLVELTAARRFEIPREAD